MRGGDRRPAVRVETRAREFTAVARLRGLRPGAVGKPTCPQHFMCEGRGPKGPGVTAVRPEAGRSSPGQGEATLTSGGGPKGCCSAKRSPDPGLGVKGQSRPVTAGSTRNGSQASPPGGRWRGRALTGCAGGEIPRHPVKLRTRHRRRRAESGARGKPVSREGNNPDRG